VTDLEAFLADMVPGEDRRVHNDGPWWASVGNPDNTFNREIAHPGDLPMYPDGVLAVRCDDDFWIVATLPYRFRDLSIETLVSTIWPEVTDAVFIPDSGSPELKAYYEEQRARMKAWYHVMDSFPRSETGLRSRLFEAKFDEINLVSENIYDVVVRNSAGELLDTKRVDVTLLT
jgi:hypothetical protein